MARSAAVGTTVDGASRRAWNPATGYAVVLLLPCLFLLVFFVWPMVTVVARSFAEQSVWFEHYATVLDRSSYLKVLLYTLQVATSVTILCLLIAYPVSAVVARLDGGWLHLCFALILIPFWTSTVIRTYAWMVLFQRKGVLNGVLVEASFFFRSQLAVENCPHCLGEVEHLCHGSLAHYSRYSSCLPCSAAPKPAS